MGILCNKCKIIKDETEFYGKRRPCKECTKQRSREYKKEHHVQHLESVRAWKEAHPEKLREQQKRHRNRYPEKHRESVSNWKKKFPEKKAIQKHRRRANLYKAEGSYTVQEWLELVERYGGKCLCCGDVKPLTVDHVVPISCGGSNSIDNIQPLCQSCNSQKGTKIIDYRPSKKIPPQSAKNLHYQKGST